MCRWNCKQLGVAWSPAMPGVEWEAALETAFDDEFALAHLEGARAKVSKACPSRWRICRLRS